MRKQKEIAAAFAAIVLGALLAPAFARAAAPAGGGRIEGAWEGALGSGAGRLRLIATIFKTPDGLYAGKLDSVDQGAVLPIERVAQDGESVRFEVGKIGGVYRGVLKDGDRELAGTWTQAGVAPQPLSFRRAEGAAVPAGRAAGNGPTPRPLASPLTAAVPVAPRAFKTNGRWTLAYEMHVANTSARDVQLTRIEVPGPGSSGKPLASFAGRDLEGMVGHPGQGAVEPAGKIAPGTLAVVYLWLTFDRREEIPETIRHRVSAKVGDYAEEVSFEGAPVAVDRRPPPVVDPPLRGGDWVAGNGPSNGSHHRRAILAIDGVARIAQRYAIDWIRRYPDGATFRGDPTKNESYRAYGAEILAAADGRVSEAKDGIPQNTPGASERAVPITLETIGGNHVLVDMGEGRFALYAHLQPGSLRVKPGERVRRGQVLGLLGNSGNSTEPHLHFQISSANSPLASEGIPYAFRSYETVVSTDSRPIERDLEMPGEDEVVRFPDAGGVK